MDRSTGYSFVRVFRSNACGALNRQSLARIASNDKNRTSVNNGKWFRVFILRAHLCAYAYLFACVCVPHNQNSRKNNHTSSTCRRTCICICMYVYVFTQQQQWEEGEARSQCFVFVYTLHLVLSAEMFYYYLNALDARSLWQCMSALLSIQVFWVISVHHHR